ncbi:hypothetical protein RFI_14198 [Reticulomyxa filosa]|uniref:Transmembrane protein n=1 Tax=Reticulomyxa filosa TaxID=46433 RepID=X6N9L9_RETFI|nr:hypothetical protein RFI_14198 [Reticulomyxa filosa]|eukprot:ETO22985.1 hypothetical protein RFI_14198 [Reticulomyxa filosa]
MNNFYMWNAGSMIYLIMINSSLTLCIHRLRLNHFFYVLIYEILRELSVMLISKNIVMFIRSFFKYLFKPFLIQEILEQVEHKRIASLLVSLQLKNLEEKVFSQNIVNGQKLKTAFEAAPVCFLFISSQLHFSLFYFNSKQNTQKKVIDKINAQKMKKKRNRKMYQNNGSIDLVMLRNLFEEMYGYTCIVRMTQINQKHNH